MNEKDTPSEEALLKDLELQWKDHFHMRDQSWKTLANTTLFFIGTVGLEIKGVGKFVMIAAYRALIAVALLGYAVAVHHRNRQRQKFAIIDEHEKLLELYDIKRSILTGKKDHSGLLWRFIVAIKKWFVDEIKKTWKSVVAIKVVVELKNFATNRVEAIENRVKTDEEKADEKKADEKKADEKKDRSGLPRFFTARFIEIMEIGIAVVAVLLLIRTIRA